jgi:hypothetical protein
VPIPAALLDELVPGLMVQAPFQLFSQAVIERAAGDRLGAGQTGGGVSYSGRPHGRVDRVVE